MDKCWGVSQAMVKIKQDESREQLGCGVLGVKRLQK